MKKPLVALALAALALFPALARAQDIPGPQPGQPAPEITVRDLSGAPVSLASLRGQVVVLNFWATWCPPCRQETPDMIAAFRKLRGRAAFLGIDSTEKAPIIRSFIAAKGLPYPVAIDQEKKTSMAYDVRGIPTTYVIDANGIVRARYVDIISPAQLTAFVDAAKNGHNGAIASALQRKIDAMLNPGRFAFPGDYEGVLREVKAATDAVNGSNKTLGESDPAKGEVTDYLRTRSEQATLLVAAANALRRVAHTDADRALLYRVEGDIATDNEKWPEAVASYQKALALSAKDQDALGGLAFAYYEQKNWGAEISAYQQLAALNPDPNTYISIGKAYLELKQYGNAIAAERKAVALAEASFRKQKTRDSTVYGAYTWLYLGRAYTVAGENASAHAAFMQTLRYGQMLPRKSTDYAKYTEEAQEADVALGLGNGGKTTVSLAPWTGPDLPGSLSSTVKYRLVVAGAPGSTVRLSAVGLSKGWLASFCTDRLCSPMQRIVALPSSGVKILEFQLIPNDARAAKHTSVRVHAAGSAGSATTSQVVASR